MINVNQAVIFVGGLGTRLGAITKRVPKPLIKIDGKPFIDHLIKKLSQNGIEEVIEVALTAQEQEALQVSIDAVKELNAAVANL